MFIGHYGAGFAGKGVDARPSLGTLFFAAQFIDLLWPVLILLGIEQVRIEPGNTAMTPLNFVYYPFSHSLFFVLIWAVLVGGVYYVIRKNARTGFVLGLLVVSHWVLDLLVHCPDLPLVPWSKASVGLGLWDSVPASLLLELFVFGGGAFLYMRATRAKNRKGSYGLWALLGFLMVIYLANVFGPPPAEAQPVAVVGLSQWLLVLWGYWIDRNRENVLPAGAPLPVKNMQKL
ncbi:MAG: hypothetical protein P8184_18440 [Calditrichia bacterium]